MNLGRGVEWFPVFPLGIKPRVSIEWGRFIPHIIPRVSWVGFITHMFFILLKVYEIAIVHISIINCLELLILVQRLADNFSSYLMPHHSLKEYFYKQRLRIDFTSYLQSIS